MAVRSVGRAISAGCVGLRTTFSGCVVLTFAVTSTFPIGLPFDPAAPTGIVRSTSPSRVPSSCVYRSCTVRSAPAGMGKTLVR